MSEVVTQDSCPFCETAEVSQSPFDASAPIDSDGDVLLKPALGMLVPGYVLAVTRDHLTSFAQLSPDRLQAVDWRLNLYQTALAMRFGNYFRIESGSDNLTDCGSGGCIEHAHMHLMPADDDVGAYIQEQLPWEKLNNYDELTELRGEPYIYLGRVASHFVVPRPNLPGQWARRQLAEVRNLLYWDWVLDPGAEELKATVKALEEFPLEIFHPEVEGL